jgi:hypothetical protein
MGSPAYNPKDKNYYNAESPDDAYYIGIGRIDLVPGTYQVSAPFPPVEEKFYSVTRAPNGQGYTAKTAEEHFFITHGRADLAPGCKYR